MQDFKMQFLEKTASIGISFDVPNKKEKQMRPKYAAARSAGKNSTDLKQFRYGKRIKVTQSRTFTIYFVETAPICGESLIKTVPPVKNMILNLRKSVPKHLK